MRKGDLYPWRSLGKVLFVFDLSLGNTTGQPLGRLYGNNGTVNFPSTGYYHCLPRELFRNERIGT